jgi:hypothetical protein
VFGGSPYVTRPRPADHIVTRADRFQADDLNRTGRRGLGLG